MLVRHSALVDLLPTSNNWQFYTLGRGVPFNTEKLLSELVDRLLDSASSIGVPAAVQILDNLLTKAERQCLAGYELTFLPGLKLCERWDIAPGLYVLPFAALPKPARQMSRITPIPNAILLGTDPEADENVTVLVGDLRWEPIVVSTKGRTPTDPNPLKIQLLPTTTPCCSWRLWQ